MTVRVKQVLDKISNNNIFDDDLYFTGKHEVLNKKEIIEMFSKTNNSITSIIDIINFVNSKEEPQDDETVYLTETNKVHLSFYDIKKQVLVYLKGLK